MEVLKKGQPQRGWSRIVICTGKGNGGGGCWSIFRVREADLFETRNTDLMGEYDSFVTCRCPYCKVLNDLNRIPDRIRYKLPYPGGR